MLLKIRVQIHSLNALECIYRLYILITNIMIFSLTQDDIINVSIPQIQEILLEHWVTV